MIPQEQEAILLGAPQARICIALVLAYWISSIVLIWRPSLQRHGPAIAVEQACNAFSGNAKRVIVKVRIALRGLRTGVSEQFANNQKRLARRAFREI